MAPADSKLRSVETLVSYSRSGGIAGSAEQLIVDRDGRAVLSTEGGAEAGEEEFELSDAELARLEGSLDAAAGIEVPPPPPGCVDCFSYSVEAEGISFSLDDTSFGSLQIPAQATGLIQLLGELARRGG